jgi:hypothetical protein
VPGLDVSVIGVVFLEACLVLTYHTLIHALATDSPLPNIVVASIWSDINIAAIDVKS